MKVKEFSIKQKCCKCKNDAVWFYMPSDECKDCNYCDDCVPRGCSCNIDPNSKEEILDNLGRKLPCCEYDFVEEMEVY